MLGDVACLGGAFRKVLERAEREEEMLGSAGLGVVGVVVRKRFREARGVRVWRHWVHRDMIEGRDKSSRGIVVIKGLVIVLCFEVEPG